MKGKMYDKNDHIYLRHTVQIHDLTSETACGNQETTVSSYNIWTKVAQINLRANIFPRALGIFSILDQFCTDFATSEGLDPNTPPSTDLVVHLAPT